MEYEWKLHNKKPSAQDRSISRRFSIPADVARLLRERGVDSTAKVDAFLHPSLRGLADPFGIHDMRTGVSLIRKAIRNGWKITIYGDYDVDGITSTSIMYLLLKHFHADVIPFDPNRFKDGYGPNLDEYKRIVKGGTKLIITTDNGITGKSEIAYAKDHGCHVIVTDHHEWPTKKVDYPDADAIIMPNCPFDPYSYTEFCGAGIAFKIAQAMLGHVPVEMLDLACLGTVADSVALTGEDRIIVANGLKRIQDANVARPGVKALAKASDEPLQELRKAGELSFTLIPRLNSLGRMKDPNPGVELLTTDDQQTADRIAKETEVLNRKRKTIMDKEADDAVAQAESPANQGKTTLVLSSHDYFPGVVGIIASRVLEQNYKPTIVIGHLKSDPPDVYRGSGRSIPEFNLFRAMDPLRDTMVSFGGHPMACGLTIKRDEIPKLRNGLEKAGQKERLDKVAPTIEPDLLLTPNELTDGMEADLASLEPCGQDNERPSIAVRARQIHDIRQLGANKKTLSFSFHTDRGFVKCIGFQMGGIYDQLVNDPMHVIVAGHLSMNHYKGYVNLQFVVTHIGHVLRAMPFRSMFARVYRYLRMSQPWQDVDSISNGTGLSQQDASDILQIFGELGFVSGDASRGYALVKNPTPRPLSKSKTYQYLSKQGDTVVTLF